MGLKFNRIKVDLTFKVEVLGTASTNMEAHEKYIAAKSEDEEKVREELASVHAAIVKKAQEDAKANEVVEPAATTLFYRDNDGNPVVYDYQLRGFFKAACKALRKSPGTESYKLTTYQQVISGLVFIEDRKNIIEVPGGYDSTKARGCSRPLRASTPQGERISIAVSEALPEGSKIQFTIKYLDLAKSTKSKNTAKIRDCIYEWLDYGEYQGLLQWRNGGKGSFTYEAEDLPKD